VEMPVLLKWSPDLRGATCATTEEKTIKICPTCGGGFEDWVEVCPDCGVALRREQEMPALPETSPGVRIASGTRKSLRPVAAALRASGIPARIGEESADLGLRIPIDGPIGAITFDGWTNCLYVSPEDAARAQKLADNMLGVAEEQAPPIAPVEETCPACGASVGASATECPECHLVFGAESGGAEDAEELPDLGLPETDSLGLPTFGSGRRRR